MSSDSDYQETRVWQPAVDAGVPLFDDDPELVKADQKREGNITISGIFWPVAHSAAERRRAFKLRKEGWTLEAIHKETGIPVSTMHQWWAPKKPRKTRAERREHHLARTCGACGKPLTGWTDYTVECMDEGTL